MRPWMIPAQRVYYPSKSQQVTFSKFFFLLLQNVSGEREIFFYLRDLLLVISYWNVSLISFSFLLTSHTRLLSYNCHLELFLLHDLINDEFSEGFWCWYWQKWNIILLFLLPSMIGCYECYRKWTKKNQSECLPHKECSSQWCQWDNLPGVQEGPR